MNNTEAIQRIISIDRVVYYDIEMRKEKSYGNLDDSIIHVSSKVYDYCNVILCDENKFIIST